MNYVILIDFGFLKARINYHNKSSLTFTITEHHGVSMEKSEMVEVVLEEIRPCIFLVAWKEEDGKTVTQLQDLEKGEIFSNATLPDGQFLHLKGRISIEM